MPSDYELVRIDETQYPQFAELVAASFGTKPSIDEIRRLFATEAFGAKNIGFIAYRDREPAAFYGVFPCRVEFEGKTHLAAQSGSTMTHPSHRKKGLFVAAGQRTFDLARDEGVRFVFGFPRKTSHPGLKRLGWSTNGSFHAYDFFAPTLPLAAMRSKDAMRPVPSVAKAFESYLVHYDPPENSVIESGKGGVKRDADLLTYKPETSTRFVVEVEGIKVWLALHRGVIGIGDMGPFYSSEQVKRVIKKLRSICIRGGIVRMVTYASPGCKLDRALEDAGYKPRIGLPICHLDLGSGLPLDNFKFVYGDFDTF
ncbi:MAG: GNAT family N-acetyltransferase [Acidobacteria bacterium]|nr:GNAT family N-acetyltransferase [Acidobacteriota bacterium]